MNVFEKSSDAINLCTSFLIPNIGFEIYQMEKIPIG